MSIAVKSGLPSLGSTEGAVISADEVSVSEDGSATASVGEDLPRGKSAYEIAKENGFDGTEAEWLASLKGATGAAGANGKDGENGKTPYVGENGNWYIGANDTGKPSRGAKGDKGEPGSPGAKGDKGDPGATPNLTIGSVTTLDAGQNATASMGGTAESPVLNLGMPKGAKGDKGDKGDTDISLGLTSAAVGQTIKVKAVDENGKPTAWEAVDDRLPNANPSDAGKALAVQQTGEFEYGYGFADIPQLVNFINLGITGASPGKLAKVKFVDEFGNPTAWEAADMPSGGGVDIVTSVSASSTDSEVPSAKCLYNLVGNITAQIDAM